MRQIVLDTETTGLDPQQGHRIIEIGCVEIKNRRVTDRTFHKYINPEREIDDGAFDVHGLSNDFLSDKPYFRDIAQDLKDFILGSEVIIHNAPFDRDFINAEFKRLGEDWKLEEHCKITDTLLLARERRPGQKNSLDALCAHYNVDNSERDLHGALLDAQILVDVYLAMTGGQASLSLSEAADSSAGSRIKNEKISGDRPALKIIVPSADELKAHEQRLDHIDRESGGNCVWKRLENPPGDN